MKKRILCFGDSNTWGAVPNSDQRYPDDVRWTGVMQNELGEDYKVIEEGYNGRTSVFDDPIEGRLSGIAYFRPCIDSQAPLDLIIIMLGTNDLKRRFGSDPVALAYGLKRYLNEVSNSLILLQKPEIMIAAPIEIDPSYRDNVFFDDMFGIGADTRSKGFSKAYKDFADSEGLHFFDAAQYGKASPEDGIHMDAQSHERVGKAMADKVMDIFK